MITLSLHLSCGRSQSATKSCFSYILQSTSSPYRKLLYSTFPYHNYYKVLVQQSTSPLLQCVTPVQYCKVLLQNYSAPLQGTTPELLRTTAKYYSRTIPHYFVLLCTPKYYSSTGLHYRVLLHTARHCSSLWYSILRSPPVSQNTTPAHLRTRKHYPCANSCTTKY